MSLLDKFKNLYSGELQSVNGMSIIPLIDDKDDEFTDVASFEEVNFEGTPNGYGDMTYKNDSDEIGIVPTNSFIISKQMAQDHAMGSSGLVPATGIESYNNACCIQSSQGGSLTSSGTDHDFGILPVSLRGSLDSSKRMRNSYNKIWDDIKHFNGDLVDSDNIGWGSSDAHLCYFFTKFEDELDNFLAEFEVVPGQVGALVYFGNALVGMELAPNRDYWNSVWNWLIRGCYGAEYLQRIKNGNGFGGIKLPDLSEVDSLDDMTTRIDGYLSDIRKDLMKVVSPSNMRLSSNSYQRLDNFDLSYSELSMGDFKLKGDIVTTDDKVVYISTIR